MNEVEARERIRVHAGFTLDPVRPGILARLRPYTGVEDADLADLVESLLRIHEGIVTAARVERESCAALWSICYFSRLLAARLRTPDPAQPAVADQTVLDRLERWIDAIEIFAIRMMSGYELNHCAFGIVERLASGDAQRPDSFSFLLPLICEMLSDGDADVRETAERALLVLQAHER